MFYSQRWVLAGPNSPPFSSSCLVPLHHFQTALVVWYFLSQSSILCHLLFKRLFKLLFRARQGVCSRENLLWFAGMVRTKATTNGAFFDVPAHHAEPK